jgi:hypothetical protein
MIVLDRRKLGVFLLTARGRGVLIRFSNKLVLEVGKAQERLSKTDAISCHVNARRRDVRKSQSGICMPPLFVSFHSYLYSRSL